MEAQRDSSARCVIDLPVRTEWKNIDLVSTGVRDCFQAVDLARDDYQTLAIIVAELLENAMKYGCWDGRCRPSFLRLRIDEGPDSTLVTVENPVDPGSRNIEELRETIAWIKSYPTAEQAYHARLLEIAMGSPEDQSRLGLVRVAFEGDCSLEASVSADHVVRVCARYAATSPVSARTVK